MFTPPSRPDHAGAALHQSAHTGHYTGPQANAEGRRALHFWSEQLQQDPSRQYFAATPTSQGGFWLGQITDSQADMDIGSRTHNGIIVITMDASGDQGGAWFHDQDGVLQERVHSFPARHSKGRASSNF